MLSGDSCSREKGAQRSSPSRLDDDIDDDMDLGLGIMGKYVSPLHAVPHGCAARNTQIAQLFVSIHAQLV